MGLSYPIALAAAHAGITSAGVALVAEHMRLRCCAK